MVRAPVPDLVWNRESLSETRARPAQREDPALRGMEEPCSPIVVFGKMALRLGFINSSI
jgi:hypothetical protein